MKNKIGKIVIIAFVAAMGLTVLTCSSDENSIPVSIMAFNNGGIISAQSQVMANARSMNIEPLTANEGLNIFNIFYNNIGELVGEITPSKFILHCHIRAYLSNGDYAIVAQDFFDFTQGIEISVPYEIPAGVTVSAITIIIGINTTGAGGLYSSVEFDWPGGKGKFDELHDHYKQNYNLGFGANPATWNGDKVTMAFVNITPSRINANYWIYNNDAILREVWDNGSFGGTTVLNSFVYYGNERRLHQGQVSGPGGSQLGAPGGQPNWYNTIVVPFTPTWIPSDASSVTLNISWNLDGIIGHYIVEDRLAETDDDAIVDILVLKNGWWNGLHLDLTVN